MLRKLLPFKITANNLLGHEIKHELLLDDLRGFRFSVKTDSLLGPDPANSEFDRLSWQGRRRRRQPPCPCPLFERVAQCQQARFTEGRPEE